MESILVLGDAILDCYLEIGVDRISAEAPIPIGLIKGRNYKLGGGSNVAANISAINGKSTFICEMSNDKNSEILTNLCKKNHINLINFQSEFKSTSTKTRIISNNHQLLRIDEEICDHPPNLYNFVKEKINNINLENEYIAVSDYGKGFFDSKGKLIDLINSRGAFCIVDPNGNTLEKYRNSFLLKPNLKEFSNLFQIKSESIKSKKDQIITKLKRFGIKHLLITMGKEGIIYFDVKENNGFHIKSEKRQVFDVTGAGDVFLAGLICALKENQTILNSSKIGSILASISVGYFGTHIINPDQYLNAKQKSDSLSHEIL